MNSDQPRTPAEVLAAQMERELALVSVCDRTPEHPLFHYTHSVGLDAILRSKQIRASHFRHLNDREELIAGERLVLDVAEEIASSGLPEPQTHLCRTFMEKYPAFTLSRRAEIYVASFSEDGNDLSQWRAYGARGGGYSLGIRLPEYSETRPSEDADLAVSLEKVEYDRDAMKGLVREALRRIVDGFALYLERSERDESHLRELWTMAGRLMFQQAGALVSRYKDAAFRSEQEWRLVAGPMKAARSGTVHFDLRPDGVVPFVLIPLWINDGEPSLSLSKVFVGPTQDAERGVRSARLLVDELGFDRSVVEHSGIPLRS